MSKENIKSERYAYLLELIKNNAVKVEIGSAKTKPTSIDKSWIECLERSYKSSPKNESKTSMLVFDECSKIPEEWIKNLKTLEGKFLNSLYASEEVRPRESLHDGCVGMALKTPSLPKIKLEKPLRIGFDCSPNQSTTVINDYRWKHVARYSGDIHIKDPTIGIVNKEQILAETSPPKRNVWQKIGLFFKNLYYKIKSK